MSERPTPRVVGLLPLRPDRPGRTRGRRIPCAPGSRTAAVRPACRYPSAPSRRAPQSACPRPSDDCVGCHVYRAAIDEHVLDDGPWPFVVFVTRAHSADLETPAGRRAATESGAGPPSFWPPRPPRLERPQSRRRAPSTGPRRSRSAPSGGASAGGWGPRGHHDGQNADGRRHDDQFFHGVTSGPGLENAA